MIKYARSRSAFRHQQAILAHLGYQDFEQTHEQILLVEAQRLAHLQTRPALVLGALTGYLHERRIEIPPYNTLRLILIQALQTNVKQIIDRYLQDNDSQLLDTVLERQISPSNFATQLFPYRLTHFKRINQSMQPGQIRQRVELFRELKQLFTLLAPLIVRLNLSDEAIRYYAQYVLDTQSKQTVQRTSERYLRWSTKSPGGATSILRRWSRSKESLSCPTWKLPIRLPKSGTSFNVIACRGMIFKLIKIDLKTVNQSIHDRDDFYDALEKASLKLQARVAGVVQALVFDEHSSPPSLVDALRLFQSTKGEISQSNQLPLDFLDMADRQRIFSPTGKLRVSPIKHYCFEKSVIICGMGV